MFGYRRGEIKGNWRKLYKEELHSHLLFTENYLGDQLEDETVRASGTNRELKMNTKFQSENVEGNS
jgi:hypothetical protein